LVGITAGCDAATPLMSIGIGLVAGLVYYSTNVALLKLRVDDPLNAVSIHGTCGIWGVVASALVRMAAGSDAGVLVARLRLVRTA